MALKRFTNRSRNKASVSDERNDLITVSVYNATRNMSTGMVRPGHLGVYSLFECGEIRQDRVELVAEQQIQGPLTAEILVERLEICRRRVRSALGPCYSGA